MLVLIVAGIVWVKQNPSSVANIPIFTNVDEKSKEEESSETSVDPNMTSVPNLVGKDYNDIVAKITSDSDYTVIKANEEIFSDKYAEGIIVSQSPEPDMKAGRGVIVVVTVSKGYSNRELPVISGQTLDAAVKALNDQGFIASPGNFISSDTVEEGKVIGYENYNAGDLAPYGSKININISTGPEGSSSSSSSN